MNITLYLNTEKPTFITMFRDMSGNPFSVGGTIDLTVGYLTSNEYEQFKPEIRDKMRAENDELYRLVNCKKVKISKIEKYVSFKLTSPPTISIDCYCEYVNN